MTENDNPTGGIQGMILSGPAARALMSMVTMPVFNLHNPLTRRRVETLRRFAHDEQKRITWGSHFLMWEDHEGAVTDNPIFGRAMDRDGLSERAFARMLDVDRILAFADDRFNLGLIAGMTYSSRNPQGIGMEVPCSWLWPIDETTYYEADLHQFDPKKWPNWVTDHLHISHIAFKTHAALVEDEVQAALQDLL
jgi:hypothetical protein